MLDWKSNLLENYSTQKLAEVVYEHYLMQLQIYALATVRWLKLHDEEAYEKRFGGILYVFLRGMKDLDAFHFERPSWAKLKAYESEFERQRKSYSATISA